MSKNYQLDGIGDNVEIGKRGPRIKDSSGVVENRNQADDGYAIVRGATPVGDNDLATKAWVETRANVRVTGQIDGGSPPAASVLGRVFICTTAGGVYTLKYLYRDSGSAWVEVVPTEGMIISVTDALSGGTDEYQADHLYVWDADGATWNDIGPAPEETKMVKAARLLLAHTDVGANLLVTMPANAIATKVKLNVTQIWDASEPTLIIGDASDTDRLLTADGNDLAKLGVHAAETEYLYGAQTAINVTLANNAGTPTQGQVRVTIEYQLI